MQKYKIEITETLQRVVEVEAENEIEAEKKVNEDMEKELIVLNSEDLVETEINEITKMYKPNYYADYRGEVLYKAIELVCEDIGLYEDITTTEQKVEYYIMLAHEKLKEY